MSLIRQWQPSHTAILFYSIQQAIARFHDWLYKYQHFWIVRLYALFATCDNAKF